MDIISKARKLESKLAQTIDRAAQQWSKSGPRGPLEVLHGVLEAVEERVEPAGRGKHVFPFNKIKVSVVAASRDERTRFAGVLDGNPSLLDRISTRLREAGCDVVGLQVRLVYVAQPDSAWGTPEYHVDFDRGSAADPPPAEPTPSTHELKLTIVNGSADKPAYALTLDRINLGRCGEVRDRRNHLLRTNHVAFKDAAGAINDTVSRNHAHIDYSEDTGDYRLFDDRSAHGTTIVRNGKTIAVPAGSRGVRLQSGDDVVLGEARLRVKMA
jgi:FHA domain